MVADIRLKKSGKGSVKRQTILLKLSGETLLARDKSAGKENGVSTGAIDFNSLKYVIGEIKSASGCGCSLGVVVGGGNIWRGGRQDFIDRAAADYAGMCATLINAIVLKEALISEGIPAIAVAPPALRIPNLDDDAPSYTRRFLAAGEEESPVMQKESRGGGGRVVIFAGGTGKPFFTTDTAAALRALEIKADLLIKATQVDGIYDSDPLKNPRAVKFDKLTYDEAIRRKLAIMDQAAFDLCREGKIPIVVYNFYTRNGLRDIISGKKTGTLVSLE